MSLQFNYISKHFSSPVNISFGYAREEKQKRVWSFMQSGPQNYGTHIIIESSTPFHKLLQYLIVWKSVLLFSGHKQKTPCMNDLEGIKISSPGTIRNFGKGRGLTWADIRLRCTKGLSIRFRCIRTVGTRIHCKSINQWL